VRTSAGIGVTVANATVANPKDVTAPVISNVTRSVVTSSAVTIGWTTNEASDTQVEYGRTRAYGSLTGLDTNLATPHSQVVGGLAPNTWYHFRIRSRDAAGNLAMSRDLRFKTGS